LNILAKLYSKYENKIKFLLVLYALYCSIKIGLSWDEQYYQLIGKLNLNYLLSFGLIDEHFFSKYRFSTLYWSLASFISQMFPQKYSFEIYHLINTIIGLFAIIGLYKIIKRLLNKEIANFSAILLFFIPFFFGHLAINNKDMIITFSHIWIIYYILKYSFKNYDFKNRFYILLKLSVLSALGTGIQLFFLGSLLPIFIIFLIYLVNFKKKSFKSIVYDLFIYLILFYGILLLFWIDAHENILVQPFIFFIKIFSEPLGWPFNLVNGQYFLSGNIPNYYLLINYFFKLPELILFLYAVSLPLIIINLKKLRNKFKNFNFILISVIALLIYPNIILFFISFPIYDGIRLFLWSVPYLVIIPSITIFLILENKKIILKYILAFLFIFHLINFLTITPYHYTYLNIFNGPKNERYKRFENDYWSTSLRELIFSSNLSEKKINFHTCGVSPEIVKNYMSQKYKRSEFSKLNEANYVIITNRTLFSNKNNKISNCFDEYSSDNVHQVVRNGIILSAIKRINDE